MNEILCSYDDQPMRNAMSTTNTTPTLTPAGFIVAQCGYNIYGYGATTDEAVAMARRWMEGDPEIRPFVGGRMAVGDTFVASATADLIELVREVGGDIGYRVINGIACTQEEEAILED